LHFKKSKKPRFSPVLKKCHTSSLPRPTAVETLPKPGAIPMQPDVNDPWQLLRLKAKILHGDIRRAREELLRTKGSDRRQIVHLEQAQRAQARAVCALSKVIYPDDAAVIRFPVARSESL
jgi:hypothetical protein